MAAWRSSDRLDEVVYTGTGPAESLQRANVRNYTLFFVNMTRWRRWDKGASGATQMMQCAQAAQGWGHACELRGTTYFIYLGCFTLVCNVLYYTLLCTHFHMCTQSHITGTLVYA